MPKPTSTTKYIDKVGIEIEGVWARAPHNFHRDGSVHVDRDRNQYQYEGETSCNPPIRPDEAETFIKTNYPDLHNKTCGLHCHISLKDVNDYVRLMDRSFFDYFLEQFEIWGKANVPDFTLFWSRFKGENQYCTRSFQPEEQANGHTGKYTILNYAWRSYKTIECRMFPVFGDSEMAVKAIHEYFRIVDSYLDNAPKLEDLVLDCDLEFGTEASLMDDDIMCIF